MDFIDASTFIFVLVSLIFISKLPDDVLQSFTEVSCILCNHDEIGKFREADWSKRSTDPSGDPNRVVYWRTKDSYLVTTFLRYLTSWFSLAFFFALKHTTYLLQRLHWQKYYAIHKNNCLALIYPPYTFIGNACLARCIFLTFVRARGRVRVHSLVKYLCKLEATIAALLIAKDDASLLEWFYGRITSFPARVECLCEKSSLRRFLRVSFNTFLRVSFNIFFIVLYNLFAKKVKGRRLYIFKSKKL